jgi:solute carrier family 45 protein 1/2/4
MDQSEPLVLSSKPLTAPPSEIPRRSIPMLLAIAAAVVAMQVAYSMEYSLSNPLMAKLGMPQWSYALVTATDPLTGLFVQPLFGSMSDRSRSKMGRRRPFILLGSFIVFVFLLFLIFTEQLAHAISPSNETVWARAILVLSLIGYNVGLNGMQNPSRTIIQDLVSPAQRVQGTFVGSLGVAFGFLVVNLIGAINMSKYVDYTNEQIVLVVGGIIFFVSIMITLIFAKEEQHLGPVIEESPFLESFKAVFHCPKPVFRAGVCIFLAFFAWIPFQVVLTEFFAIDIYEGNPLDENSLYDDGVSFGMLVLTVMSGVMMIYCFFADKIVSLIGARWAFAVCEMCDVIAFTAVFYTKNKWVLLCLITFAGPAFSSAVAINHAIIGLSVPK